MMQCTNRWLGVLVALIAALPFAAQAQDAGEIARHAVAAMQRATVNTQDDLQSAATRGVGVIRQLDADGAPDRQLVAAAERAWSAIDAQARQGVRHVNLIAARANEALREIQADRRFFVIVRDARDAAHEAIGQSRRRATHAVQVALDAALRG